MGETQSDGAAGPGRQNNHHHPVQGKQGTHSATCRALASSAWQQHTSATAVTGKEILPGN